MTYIIAFHRKTCNLFRKNGNHRHRHALWGTGCFGFFQVCKYLRWTRDVLRALFFAQNITSQSDTCKWICGCVRPKRSSQIQRKKQWRSIFVSFVERMRVTHLDCLETHAPSIRLGPTRESTNFLKAPKPVNTTAFIAEKASMIFEDL